MERIHMSKGLKAFGIFAGMVALPLLVHGFIAKKPDKLLSGALDWSWVLVPIVLLLVVFAIVFAVRDFWKFEGNIQGIQGNLKLAERELTKLLADNWDQAGRKGKVEERAQWAAMAHPTVIHVLKGADGTTPAVPPAVWSPLTQPSIALTFNENYRTVAHEAFELNHQDMKGRGAAMGKATMTAVLLRELYQGSPGRAIKKIVGEFKGGSTPFIAPGVRELLDFDKFDKSKNAFAEDHKPVNWLMLTLAVKQGQFPKELVLIDKGTLTPEGKPTRFKGWEVIKKLTEPGSKEDWDIPKPEAPVSMWKIWREWQTTSPD
jgi:hypothetical protein